MEEVLESDQEIVVENKREKKVVCEQSETLKEDVTKETKDKAKVQESLSHARVPYPRKKK
ncbi:hypothetical protein A2U01_0097583, partial [Trifolium medium]|nr:hypothetical protein [Trifolium medium]